MAFFGCKDFTMDLKGRLSIPAAFRKELAINGINEVVLTPAEQCLRVYTPTEFELFCIETEKTLDSDTKKAWRMYTARADTCEINEQGRITLAPAMRERAGLKKKVVIIGRRKYFEIWDQKQFAAYETENDVAYNLLLKKIS